MAYLVAGFEYENILFKDSGGRYFLFHSLRITHYEQFSVRLKEFCDGGCALYPEG